MKRALLVAALLVCTAAGAARPVKIVRNGPALQFTYEWPAEAAAVPALEHRFRAEAAREYRRQLRLGREDKKLYDQQQRGSVTDFYSKTWSTAGETARLLSLEYRHATYTGGAHPNTDYGALLWDLRLGRAIGVVDLFVHAQAFQERTRGAYCAALDRERAKRRGGNREGSLAEFDACPKYSDLAIAPLDTNRNGRFDAIEFVASPYTAGPYAEGAYSIRIAVTPRLVAALKRDYRASFEVQRQ